MEQRVVVSNWRRPLLWGTAGTVGLLLFYAAIVGLTSRSLSHAVELLLADKYFVGAISLGFGTQIALYSRLRAAMLSSRDARTSNVVTATGTGTSTASMVACCLHHLTDVLPVIGISGAAVFLSEFRYELMGLGIAMNLLGIGIMLRTMKKVGLIGRTAEVGGNGRCH